MRPFHSGFVKSSMRVGSWSGVRFSALYTTHARPAGYADPTDFQETAAPCRDLLRDARRAVSRTSLHSPLRLGPPRVLRKEHIGGASFSPFFKYRGRRCRPFLPYFTATLMPVTSSNCAMMGETSDSLLPEYTTSVPGSLSRTTSTIFSTSTTFSTGTSCTRTISFSTSDDALDGYFPHDPLFPRRSAFRQALP